MDRRVSPTDTAEDSGYGRYLDGVPVDLTLLLAVTILTTLAVYLPVVRTTPIRPILGFLFVLFVPGYAIVAAFFPAGPNATGNATPGPIDYRIGWYEWVGLSTVLSLGLVSLTGYVVNLSPARMSLATLLPSTMVLTEVALCVAIVRRRRVPRSEQSTLQLGRKLSIVRSRIERPLSTLDLSLNVLLFAFLLVSVVAAGNILAQPPDESTSFYLLSENEEGQLRATALPANATPGESIQLTVGVDNHESDRYTVILTRQRAGTDGQATLEQYRLEPGSGDSFQQEVEIAAPDTEGRYTLSFLLYRGDPPESPTASNAYRTTTHTITVETGSEPVQTTTSGQ